MGRDNMQSYVQNERDHHRHAFAIYRGMGPHRRQVLLAKKIGVPKATIKLWARSFHWRERLEQEAEGAPRSPLLASEIPSHWIATGRVSAYFDGWRDGFMAAYSVAGGFRVNLNKLKEFSRANAQLETFVRNIKEGRCNAKDRSSKTQKRLDK